MLINALRGLPAHAAEALVTQQALLEAVGSKKWVEQTAERGSGVGWDEFEHYLRLSLEAFRLNAEIEVLRPHEGSARALPTTDMQAVVRTARGIATLTCSHTCLRSLVH
jgi:hypothetical protein